MPHTLTEAELGRIQNFVAAATPEPWHPSIEGRDHVSGPNAILTPREVFEAYGVTHADCDFIAEARQGVPRLMAEVRALRSGSPSTGVTESELDRIEGLCAAATPGPWTALLASPERAAGPTVIRTAGRTIELVFATDADYQFVADSRQSIPRLLADVRSLRSRLQAPP